MSEQMVDSWIGIDEASAYESGNTYSGRNKKTTYSS